MLELIGEAAGVFQLLPDPNEAEESSKLELVRARFLPTTATIVFETLDDDGGDDDPGDNAASGFIRGGCGGSSSGGGTTIALAWLHPNGEFTTQRTSVAP